MAADSTCEDNSGPCVQIKAGSSLVRYKPLFSSDSKYLFVCSGSVIKVFSTNSSECVHDLCGHKNTVVSVQLNPKNKLQLLSCDQVGTVIQWDYEDGILLKTYELKKWTTAFYAPNKNSPWFIVGKHKHKGDEKLFSVKNVSSGGISFESLLQNVSASQQKLAFGVEAEYVASVYHHALRIYWFKKSKLISKRSGSRLLTCIAAHPHEYCLATGDETGRILIWSDFLSEGKPVMSIHHWHTLAVSDVAFSSEGRHFYSGGGECVLVRWRLGTGSSHMDCQFLPRMGMPLCYITPSGDNSYIATSHVDNAIQLVNAHNRIVQIYQGLTQGHQWTQSYCSVNVDKPVPTGLLFDPRTKALVLNGKPGHLQFYSLDDDKQLYNLDIVCQNYLTQERHTKIINTDIIKACFDNYGMWLCTVEYRNDGVTFSEQRLKFWRFNSASQRFRLNTTIEYPHKDMITNVTFQPPQLSDESTPRAITLSEKDKTVKFWTVVERPGVGADEECWNCESVGYYRSLSPFDACFSEDGSLIGIAFGNVLTLWIPETNSLKSSLVHPKIDQNIRRVVFGRKDCCHLVAVATETSLTVWNVISLSVCWHVELNVVSLISDINSDLMATFADDKVFIFRPSNPKPIFEKNISSNVVHSAFVPTHRKCLNSALPWQPKSMLVFMDSEQQIYIVSREKRDNGKSAIKIGRNVPLTPFGMLMAEKSKSGIERNILAKHKFSGVPGRKEISDLINTPSHVLAPASLLCANFITSLLISKSSRNDQPVGSVKIDIADERGDDDDVDVDMITTDDEDVNGM